MRIVGLNMQGANAGTGQSKRTSTIQQFFKDKNINADIVCAQEAGPQPPPGGAFTPILPANYPPWIGLPPPGVIFFANWALSGFPYIVVRVLWIQTDPNGNRCNLCIFIKDDHTINGLIWIPPAAGFGGSRGAIGIDLTPSGGGTTRRIYTLHGLSGMGAANDAFALAAAIAAAPAGAGGGAPPPWDIVGDFNRPPTPAGWPTPPGIPGVLCPPNGPTLPSHNSLLDYALRSAAPPVTGIVQKAGSVSDHQYVIYNL